MFKAHRLVYHSTLGLKAMKTKKMNLLGAKDGDRGSTGDTGYEPEIRSKR